MPMTIVGHAPRILAYSAIHVNIFLLIVNVLHLYQQHWAQRKPAGI